MLGLQYLHEIDTLLAILTSHVKISTKNGWTDAAKYSEIIFTPILTTIFNKKFELLEFRRKDMEAVDVGCDELGIAFQITATTGIKKVKKCIDVYLKNRVYEKYPKLYILVIDEISQPKYKKIVEYIDSTAKELNIELPKEFSFTISENYWNISILSNQIRERLSSPNKLSFIKNILNEQYNLSINQSTEDEVLNTVINSMNKEIVKRKSIYESLIYIIDIFDGISV